MMEDTHWNTHRPPVGMWVYIKREGLPKTKVIRKSWITTKSYNLIYFTEDGEQIEGEFPWQYV